MNIQYRAVERYLLNISLVFLIKCSLSVYYHITVNLILISVRFTDWHKHRVAALCSLQFDQLLRECPEYHSTKSCFAAFVLERGLCDSKPKYVVPVFCI